VKQILSRFVLAAMLIFAGQTVCGAATINSASDLQTYASNMFAQQQGVDNINGAFIDWFPGDVPGSLNVMIGGQSQMVTVRSVAEAVDLLSRALGISLAVGSVADPNSPAATTSRLVFDNLVLPQIKTGTEVKRESAQKALGRVRSLGAMLRSDFIKNQGDEGTIYGFNVGLAQDYDNYTFGIVIPYDRLDFDLLHGDRTGIVAFGQYHLKPAKDWIVTLTGNVNYLYTGIRSRAGSGYDLNTYGGGASISGRYVKERYELGTVFSYQYDKSDVSARDDEQHIVKFGLNGGYRLGENHVISGFGSWTYDATHYSFNPVDDDFFELGGEYRMNLTDTWSLNLSYRKILGMDRYRSDLIVLGSLWQF
jgi:hypothetical protein